jgi:hypothetical protein
MQSGLVDPAGQGATEFARNLGTVGVLVNASGLVIGAVVVVLALLLKKS